MWTWVARYAAYMYCKGQGKHLEWIVVWERSQKITIPLKFHQLRRGCFATGFLTDEVRIDTCQPRKLTKQQHGDAHDLRSSKIVVESPTLF